MAERKLSLLQAPMDFNLDMIVLLMEIEKKYDIEIKDSEAIELTEDRFDKYNIEWKPSYIKEFRDSTSSKDWKEWADEWLEKYDK